MCFLDDKIYHDISKGDFRSFDALLNIMKKRDFRTLNNLAEKIKVALVVEAEISRNNSEGDVTGVAVTSSGGLMVVSLDSSKFISYIYIYIYALHKAVAIRMSLINYRTRVL